MSRKIEGKKILVFAQSDVGGAERMSVTITKSLDRDKFKVEYYLVGDFEDERAPLKQFIPDDLSVHCIGSCSSILLILKFFFILAKEKPDVVFASVLNINNKLLVLRKLFRHVKFVIRCDNYLYTYNDKQRRIILKTYPNADIIIAQTEEMKQELIDEMHISEDKVVVLQNPVDTETINKKIQTGKIPYSDDGKVRYVASGRFAYQKGFDLLVEAFAIVKEQQPEAELYIVGRNDGGFEDYYNEVKQLIEKHGLQDSVKCVGFQNNPYVYIKYADCFVLSSRWEGLPNVMIESLYLGTPVAAFKCIPVIERIVTDGADGYLAEKENVESLAKAMMKASELGRVISVYKSASMDDFHHVLEFATKPGGGKRLRLKYIISLTPPISWYLDIRKKINDKRLYKLREQYIPDIRKLITPDTSIISSNCFAGRIMQDLGMQYNTPTLGLYFFADDYIEFLSNLKYYLTEAKLEFLEQSRYPLANERREKWIHWYPIGILGGKVEIQFLHYHTEREAANKWYRRSRRVNFDKLLVIGMEQNLTTVEHIKQFDALPFKNKIFFSSKNLRELNSNCCIDDFTVQGEVGDPYRCAEIFYRELIERK
ncbi:DUF1919 domain-containing protein [uncultured Prevotellamassilia sp.]|uniref:DUF1919 domain-containing protein n=1 Tax=uncultured Prevotellamassilia sp. TaxID=1926676 RepID=UPI0025943EE2|nr:DUF1919 domain-containing protein [uncultured Prevotellamassilia sp.]